MAQDARRAVAKSARGNLDGIALLAALDRRIVAEIAQACTWQSVSRGRELFGAGVASADVHFVERGVVRVTTFSATGREVSFRDLGPGSTLGTVAAIDGQPRSAAVIAVETATVAILPREKFLTLLGEHPSLAMAVLNDFASLIRELTQRVVATTTATIPVRVRQELLTFARAAGIANNKAVLERLPTHADFATRIGATREAVTRELNKLTKAGLLAKAGKSLVITDVGRLEQLADES